jgi:hypothetical protein
MLNAKPVGLGLSGAMYHPKISPYNPKLMFVACDMLGLYRSDKAGDQWTMTFAWFMDQPGSVSLLTQPTTNL